MSADWRRSLERAHAAHSEWMAEERGEAEREYRFTVGFTIPEAVARRCRMATCRDGDGLRVEMEFFATEEAKEKVIDVIARFPVTCRSYHRWYDEAPGGG